MATFIDTDPTLRALQFSLDGLSKRAQVASDDVANADTPNYKASEVTFESSLRKALSGKSKDGLQLMLTDGAHIDPDDTGGAAQISETPLLNAVLKNDNNSVDVDREMTTLAESQVSYAAMVQLAATKLAIVRSAIQDTRP